VLACPSVAKCSPNRLGRRPDSIERAAVDRSAKHRFITLAVGGP
jgi:hypothetical protein